MGGGRGGMGGPGGDRGGNSGGGAGGDVPGAPGGDIPGMPGGSGTSGNGTSSDRDSSADDSSTSIKGLKAAGDLIINGGSFVMDCADDAVHSNASVSVNGGTLEIATGDDGFHADDTLTVTDGIINITESYEGFEGLHILVSGGDSKMVTTNDGLNAAGGTDASGFGGNRGDMFGRGGMGGMGSGSSDGTIVITGGTVYVKASGDGIDANGTLEIRGGDVIVCGPTTGDTATLDYDLTGVITGGTFIGTGGSMMAQTFSDSQQGVFAVSVGNMSAGTEIVLTDAAGNVLISYTPELDFAVVILSSPDLVKGESYTITVGGQSGTFEAQ
ncbi:MAG: carbohydrate-binding domain-containing protein [Lachnospiraceae bacterium]|nr:carbohydrate-binding domain-containing protein [Lachnospiraceae bacterium]